MTHRLALAAALACAAACHADAAPGAPAAPPKGPTVSQADHSNVHARLRLTKRGIGVPEQQDELEIWIRGTRFRIRDAQGRSVTDLIADLDEPRGLGAQARTMEEIMDRQSQADHRAATASPRPSDLYGDRATDAGRVYPARGEPRPIAARRIAPLVDQIFARDRASGLARAGEVTRLGRAAVEYRDTVPVVADGKPAANVVVRVIASPFLLLDAAHDATVPAMSYVREIVALDEGPVSEADVTPP